MQKDKVDAPHLETAQKSGEEEVDSCGVDIWSAVWIYIRKLFLLMVEG